MKATYVELYKPRQVPDPRTGRWRDKFNAAHDLSIRVDGCTVYLESAGRGVLFPLSSCYVRYEAVTQTPSEEPPKPVKAEDAPAKPRRPSSRKRTRSKS